MTNLWESYVIDLFENPISDRNLIKEKTLKKSGVYIWINKINHKFYIGSSVNLYPRIRRYYQLTYLAYIKHKDLPICRAIQKYSLENFKFGILIYCNPLQTIEKEQFFFDILKPNYNVLKTAGLKSPKKERKSMSQEQKLKLSFKKGENHHSYGIKRTDDELRLMRDNHPKTKKVYQYLSDKKTLVMEYPSLRELTKRTGITRDYIVKCIKNQKLVHNKWWFSYQLI